MAAMKLPKKAYRTPPNQMYPKMLQLMPTFSLAMVFMSVHVHVRSVSHLTFTLIVCGSDHSISYHEQETGNGKKDEKKMVTLTPNLLMMLFPVVDRIRCLCECECFSLFLHFILYSMVNHFICFD